MLSRLIDGCSIRQAARHVASIMARRKVENNVTCFHPTGWREHFGPVSHRFYQLKLALSSSVSHGQIEPHRSTILCHLAAVVILHWSENTVSFGNSGVWAIETNRSFCTKVTPAELQPRTNWFNAQLPLFKISFGFRSICTAEKLSKNMLWTRTKQF